MSTKVLALTSALLATVAFASVAEAAGNGVKLGFGFPLGSFTATPSGGGGGGGGGGSGYRKAARHKAPVEQASRKAVTPRKTPSSIAKEEEPKKDETVAATPASTEPTPSTGSTALIQSQTRGKESAAETPAAAGETTAEAPAAETAESAQTAATDQAASPPAEDTPAAAASGDGKCTKFIPALGTTVSVGCDQ
jgi:hypothetical protein